MQNRTILRIFLNTEQNAWFAMNLSREIKWSLECLAIPRSTFFINIVSKSGFPRIKIVQCVAQLSLVSTKNSSLILMIIAPRKTFKPMKLVLLAEDLVKLLTNDFADV